MNDDASQKGEPTRRKATDLSGIMPILELILSDTTKGLQETISNESASARSYDESKINLLQTQAASGKGCDMSKDRVTKLEADMQSTKNDVKTIQDEINNLNDIIETVQKEMNSGE